MATDLGPLMAILVLVEWCTMEEAEQIRRNLTSREMPGTVAGCLAQFEATLAAVRGE